MHSYREQFGDQPAGDRLCRCGHRKDQHRGAKRTGGCFGWKADVAKRCECNRFRADTGRPVKPKTVPLATVIPISAARSARRRA